MFESALEWIKNLTKPEDVIDQSPTIQQMVDDAKSQWQNAISYFENVSDPELVDYAINNLEAAEKRYNYLLKQLREQ